MSDDDNIDDKENKELNPLQVAEIMKKDLQKVEHYETRKEVIDYLRDQFVAQRIETSSKQEKLREMTINKILTRLEGENVPLLTLMKLLESLGKGNEADITSILGKPGPGGLPTGVNVQINNQQPDKANSNESSSGTPPIKDVGFMLEAMKTFSEELKPEDAENIKKIIDVTPEKPKDD